MKPMNNSEPIRRRYPPIPIVSVGVLLYDKETNKILLIKRASEPGKGKYSIPGGVVELGEKLIDAAKREVMEEVSIQCRILGIIHIDEIIIRDEEDKIKWHYVLIDLLAEPLSKNITPASDAEDALWVSIEKAKTMNLTVSTRKLIEKFSAEKFCLLKTS